MGEGALAAQALAAVRDDLGSDLHLPGVVQLHLVAIAQGRHVAAVEAGIGDLKGGGRKGLSRRRAFGGRRGDRLCGGLRDRLGDGFGDGLGGGLRGRLRVRREAAPEGNVTGVLQASVLPLV